MNIALLSANIRVNRKNWSVLCARSGQYARSVSGSRSGSRSRSKRSNRALDAIWFARFPSNKRKIQIRILDRGIGCN